MIWNIVLIVIDLFLLVVLISVCLKTEQQEKRILYLEKRWAESQRRQSMYSQLVKPSKKALESMGDFGIEDIEKTVEDERCQETDKTTKSRHRSSLNKGLYIRD